jgi:hypothetical protein
LAQTRSSRRPPKDGRESASIEGDSDNEEAWEDVNDEPAADLGVAYPYPVSAIAQRPTRTRLRGSQMVDEYGATDLIPALQRMMRSRLGVDRATVHQLASPNSDRIDLFKVWHRLRLFHRRLPFAPRELL